MLLYAQSALASATLPPIRWWGELGYDFRSDSFEEGEDLKEHAGIVRLNASSYIYQPWLALVEGGLGLSVRQSETGPDSSDSDTITGDALLRVFPQSRFPFEAFVERSDSSTDTDLTGLEIERTRYGFLQRYTTRGGTGFRFGMERSELTNQVSVSGAPGQDGRREDVSELLRAGFNRSFGFHALSFDTTVNQVDMVDSSDRTRTSSSSLRHSYRPGATLFADDLLSYNSTDIEQGNTRFESGLLQLNSYAFWRPRERSRLRVNASLRALARDTRSNNADSSSLSLTPVLGASYRLGQHWLINGSIGATGVDTDDDREHSSFQTASAIYNSDTHRLGKFDAGWFGQLNARNNSDEEGSVRAAGADAGYNLGRDFGTPGSASWRLDWRQSLGAVADTDDFSSRSLLSTASLAWSNRSQSASSMVRLTASDSRTWASGDEFASVEGNFQIINFQASMDYRLSGRSALLGNMTLQATRDEKPERAGIDDRSNGEWTPTATVDMSYVQRHLFGIPRLSFRSTARFISDSYFPVLDETRTRTDRDDKQWENRLEYTIGRLDLRAIARVAEIRGLEQSMILFQVRRRFGDS